jgi:hypothetical protein
LQQHVIGVMNPAKAVAQKTKIGREPERTDNEKNDSKGQGTHGRNDT